MREKASSYSSREKARRTIWNLAWLMIYRPTPRVFHGWRRGVLRLFGAKIGAGTRPYPAARFWAPWNLVVGKTVGIADGAEIYNPGLVVIGDFATISQGAYICAASHDYTRRSMPLAVAPIRIERYSWIAARAIVHMGITIHEGCVIGAGSVVTKSMPPWTVCAGNPCRVIKKYAQIAD